MPSNVATQNGDHYTPPPHQLATWIVLGIAVVLVLALFSVRTKHNPESSRDYPSRTLPAVMDPPTLKLSEGSDEFFPCSDCHDGSLTNFTQRELVEEHDTLSLQHGNQWCLHCHDSVDRDRLHLADGSKIEFEESWKLCTQCHPTKLPDWQAGGHGKQTGNWHGAKERWTCVLCHNPHAPTFQQIEPLPAPKRPGRNPAEANHDKVVQEAEPAAENENE